jgi:DNA-directed RNA polymerase specialized sigma24 family protein
MQRLSSLSEIHSEFILGRMNRKTLEGLIFQYLLDNFERYRMFSGDRDMWIDFISWLYSRLSRAIDYYKETGSSFDAYISTIIQWSYKEYRTREAEHYTTEFACWKARAEEMAVSSTEAEYYAEPESNPKMLFPLVDIKHKHILILILKSYYFLTDDFLNRVAITIKINKGELRKMIDKLHQVRSRREEKIQQFRNRIHSQYYRCLAFEKRLSSAQEGTAKYEKLKCCLQRARKRYSSMKKRIQGIRMDATNQQVADILNIPRGTVDSALHSIREKLKQNPVLYNIDLLS